MGEDRDDLPPEAPDETAERPAEAANAADPKWLGRRKRASERRESRDRDDLRWVMADARGRRFVQRLLASAGVYRLSYVRGDAMETAFNEGRRNLGNELLARIELAASEKLAIMMQEARKEEQEDPNA